MCTLRVLVQGDSGVGKSALSVRYLTKRYLGEYMSDTDLLYRCGVQLEDECLTVEILDSSSFGHKESKYEGGGTEHVNYSLEQQMLWADAIIIMYSIVCRSSFELAQRMLQTIQTLKPTISLPVIILGNKRDLVHRREVSLAEGRKTAEEYGCQFYELSAAESSLGVSLAFESLLREAQALRICRSKTFPRRRRSSLISVSKMIGAMFGKSSKYKKRPSLSL